MQKELGFGGPTSQNGRSRNQSVAVGAWSGTLLIPGHDEPVLTRELTTQGESTSLSATLLPAVQEPPSISVGRINGDAQPPRPHPPRTE